MDAVDLTYIRLRHGDINQILSQTSFDNRGDLKQFVRNLPKPVLAQYLASYFDFREEEKEYMYFIPIGPFDQNRIVNLVEQLLLEYHGNR